MPKYETRVTVTEVRGDGKCPQGLKAGDAFTIREDGADFCNWAYCAIFPFISAMRYGATFPWEPNSEEAYACCPDPHRTVVFKIERLEEVK